MKNKKILTRNYKLLFEFGVLSVVISVLCFVASYNRYQEIGTIYCKNCESNGYLALFFGILLLLIGVGLFIGGYIYRNSVLVRFIEYDTKETLEAVEKLEELKIMLDNKTITKDEFDKKKEKLLEKI